MDEWTWHVTAEQSVIYCVFLLGYYKYYMGHSTTAYACASVDYNFGCPSRIITLGCSSVSYVQGKYCILVFVLFSFPYFWCITSDRTSILQKYFGPLIIWISYVFGEL